jgi:hypothetical protein
VTNDEIDTILDRIDVPREGDAVAILTKRGDVVTGTFCGTIPGRHDHSDWFQRVDRWVIAEDEFNVAHIPTPWLRQAVVEARC